MQEYLNYIARSYPTIPTVTADGDFGEATAAQVKAFKTVFGYNSDNERVTPQIWNAITSVYDDLYENAAQASAAPTDISAQNILLCEGDVGEDVIILSTMIKMIEEYYFGVSDIRISSYFGKELAKSIRGVRKIFSLPERDSVDNELLFRLDDEVRAIRMKKKRKG